MRTATLRLSALLLALLLTVSQAQPVLQATTTGPIPTVRSANSAELYSTLGGATTSGTSTQLFPDFSDATLNTADDFVVPVGAIWQIEEIVASGFYSLGAAGTPSSISVYILGNTAGDLPDTINLSAGAIYAAEGLTTYSDVSGAFIITLPGGGVQLPAGTYWLIIRPTMAFNGANQWFWFNSAVSASGKAHSPVGAAWFQNQDLIGTDCVNVWGRRVSTCGIVGTGGDTSQAFALNGTSTSLPVELTSFEAFTEAGTVRLNWTTASETDNAGFEVHSKPAGLDQPFTVHAFVSGAGTTLEAQTYTHELTNLAPGRHLVRLKQIDFDGQFEFSPTVEVTVDLPDAYVLTGAYPNPFNPSTQFLLTVAEDQDLDIGLFDLNGRRVAEVYQGRIEANTQRAFRIEAGELPSGVYLYRITGLNFTASETISLVR